MLKDYWVGLKAIPSRAINWFENLPRPTQLLLFFGVTVGLALACDASFGWQVWDKLFYPSWETPADVQAWSALIYAPALALGLPVAFLLWHWRDRNVRDQIENARKDTNLKEFQEVQLRAAGALDEKLPAEAREQLQIAALHQLRGFLRGEYGESFKRPAFEMLLASHAAAVHRIGVPEVQAQVSDKSRWQINAAVAAVKAKLTPIDRTRMRIIRDEAQHIFTTAYPIDGRRFDLLDLKNKKLLARLSLRHSHFFGANLSQAHLGGVDLRDAHLEGTDLRWALLEGTNLDCADLEGADLYMAHLEGADLRYAALDGAMLRGAHLEGADLFGAQLEGADLLRANLKGARLSEAQIGEDTQLTETEFNNATQFSLNETMQVWADYSEEQKNAARAPWIARGMINVDAQASPPPDGATGA